MKYSAETIYALSSAPGRAGIAVVRISGREAGAVYRAFTGLVPSRPRFTRRTIISDPANGERLDDGLAVWFPSPNSFTGEDLTEFYIHGGIAAPSAVLDALSRWPKLRLAEPGEFTRRAFHEGKLDLTEAEGIIDLIDAETEAQRRQALRQSSGALRKLYENWNKRLVGSLAHLEADIDFPDEDLPKNIAEELAINISCVLGEIAQHMDDMRRGERLRSGVYVAIIGPPNAGKSSLLNVLARRDLAIVSSRAGTTRDVIEVHLDLGGYPVVVADTAGIRDAADEIEQEGVRRALGVAASSDLKVAIFDAAEPEPELALSYIDSETIIVINKIDQAKIPDWVTSKGIKHFPLSVLTGVGIETFLAELQEFVIDQIGVIGSPMITRVRHREALGDCAESLRRALNTRQSELAAEDVRLAVRALGRITGRVDVEDVLDVVFRDFCIGK